MVRNRNRRTIMKYTEFGEYFRILRLKNREVLADAKQFLGVSSAFISSVECGKRSVPSDWFDLIVKHYNLNSNEQDSLREAIEKSKTAIKFDLLNASQPQKNVAIQLQRTFDSLDEETANQLLEILERNK